MANDDDPRALIEVVADADWQHALYFAAMTETEPERWFRLLQEGIPYRKVLAIAEQHVRQRRAAFMARKAKAKKP
jgi:hypothetical protein